MAGLHEDTNESLKDDKGCYNKKKNLFFFNIRRNFHKSASLNLLVLVRYKDSLRF